MPKRQAMAVGAIDMRRAAAPLSPDDVRTELVIAPHHPDALRRPAPRIGTLAAERFVQTLTWNVFRTLELLSPPFWLRRFHARLTGGVQGRAARIAAVSLWPALPLPAADVIATGRWEAAVDVLIETEHTVWALLAADNVDLRDPLAFRIRMEAARRAATSRAGTRECWIGTLGATPHPASRANRPDALDWDELAVILRECRDSDLLSPIERALADNVVRWLTRVGISARDAHAF